MPTLPALVTNSPGIAPAPTCNSPFGVSVPMPTLPADVTTILVSKNKLLQQFQLKHIKFRYLSDKLYNLFCNLKLVNLEKRLQDRVLKCLLLMWKF